METQTESPVQRKSQGNGRMSAQNEAKSVEEKSVKAIIGENLDKDTQKQIDDVMKRASEYINTGKNYISENRGEALALGVAVGVAVWALFYTKPGRQIFEMAAPKIIPQISSLLSETLGGVKA